MNKVSEIEYLDIQENVIYEKLINTVLEACFKLEGLETSKVYISVTLTDPKHIRMLNKQYRNIDKETDVLSFPMFEKEDIEALKFIEHEEVLGDIIISIEKVKEQAVEYGHSFERELAYMVVHGFYHLMGEDHIEEMDKQRMREKEETVLKQLQIVRDS